MNLHNNRLINTLIFLFFCIILIFVLGRDLNPFSDKMFTFHDITQNARVLSYTSELKELHIPPQISSLFSFKMGYPIFLFYAPTSYIITSFFNIIGFNASSSIQFSFLSILIVGFLGAYLFLKNKLGLFPAIGGSVVYITSLYFPVTIFVRGNLAEGWLLALFPLALWFLSLKKYSFFQFLSGIIIISLLLTSHNALSFVSLIILFGFVIVSRAGKATWSVLLLGLLATSYFYLPFILENGLTWAKVVALQTNYNDHFLCINQLWNSPWGFGGSTNGCNADGMSFKVGKIQLLLFIVGVLTTIYSIFWIKIKKQKILINFENLYFICIFCIAVFLTTNVSKIFWDAIPFLQLFQYPWRFLAFIPISIAFVSAVQLSKISIKNNKLVVLILIFSLLIVNGKYYFGQKTSKIEFEKKYSSLEYSIKKAPFSVPEYLPKIVDYTFWRSLENKPERIIFDYNKPFDVIQGSGKIILHENLHKTIVITKNSIVYVNIHYMPYWHISVNKNKYIPTSFDNLGRPKIIVLKNSVIDVQYQSTGIENIGNILTILAIILGVVSYKKIYG